MMMSGVMMVCYFRFFDGDTFLIDSKIIVLITAFQLATLSANKHFLWP
jgi:hypothetical protein